MDDGPYKFTRLRSLDTIDLQKLAALFETTYPGREISNPDYLKWEYDSNPAGKAIIFVAEERNNFVSQYAVLPRVFSINNTIISGSLSANTLTHPSHKGRGLFPKLAGRTFEACRQNGINFTIGFPNRQSHPVIRKNNLFETPGYLPLLVRLLNPFKVVTGYLSSPSMKSGEEIMLDFDQSTFPDGISTFDPVKDNLNHEAFLKSVNAEKINLTYRSVDFLKWRYSDIPLRKYYSFKESAGGRIISESVFRAKHIFGMRCGILVDFVCRAEEGKASKMMSFINKVAKLNSLDILITTASEGSPEHKLISLSGFNTLPGFMLPQKLAFIVRSHDKSAKHVSDFKSWFLTFGDYDIF